MCVNAAVDADALTIKRASVGPPLCHPQPRAALLSMAGVRVSLPVSAAAALGPLQRPVDVKQILCGAETQTERHMSHPWVTPQLEAWHPFRRRRSLGGDVASEWEGLLL